MVATASSRAQFASIYPSAGSFITYITRAIAAKVTAAAGVITILGYLIAFAGIYIVAGSYCAERFLQSPYSGIGSDHRACPWYPRTAGCGGDGEDPAPDPLRVAG